MLKTKVYFSEVNKNNLKDVSNIALKLFKKVIEENKIALKKEVPIKVHPGAPGNVTFIKPENYTEIINDLLDKKIKTYFIETNTATGPRSKADTHLKAAKEHGFTQISFVIADGEKGFDHVKVEIKSGKHFKSCLIATKLANQSQIIVLSHFKGHIMSGFGAAIKHLGIGFASGRGKIDAHSKVKIDDDKTVDWSKSNTLYSAKDFRERSAEYALAAVNKNQYIYLNFALSISDNCDCDGQVMTPVYEDLGVFASLDPVAIDKACFDMLEKREGKKPFDGEEIFSYSEKIGLGKKKYQLIKID
jgi:hypothetical protein